LKKERGYEFHKILSIFSLMIMCFNMAGCSAISPSNPDAAQQLSPTPLSLNHQQPEVMTSLYHNHQSSDGSLWVDDGALGQMFINAKARRIGDILTIKIMEVSSASNQATTKTGRSSSLDAGLEKFFNLEERFPSTSPFFNPFGAVKGAFDSNFDGSGSTARSNALNAYITVRIIDILPNGNLVIQGNREVRVNHENQIITLTGLVRPRDISADNVVQSTYLADARISYSGSGIINERQRPGWLTRVMGKIWPF
jgi:flagellar L-ring protein precursor FlgH